MKFIYNAGDQPLAGFTIKRSIHRGGFGEVYYATTDAGKEVALKLLHDSSSVELRGVSQCLNLKHPHLVTIYDIKTDDAGDQWVVMEYVAGETLAQLIERHPQGMPVDEVKRIVGQIVDGLEFMHSRSLVHRDLKPANIFIEAGQAKIGDVGLSKFIGPSTRSAQTQSVGTVHYMAPEIAKGNYGVGVDIYALGIIAYEMLTGRVPFEGESTGEILMKHLTDAPDLSLLESPFRAAIGKALAKQESLRYQSLDQFRQAFLQTESATNDAASFAAADRQPAVAASVRTASHSRTVVEDAAVCRTSGWPQDGSWWWLAGMFGLLLISIRGGRYLFAPSWFGLLTVGLIVYAAIYCLRRFNARPALTPATSPRANRPDHAVAVGQSTFAANRSRRSVRPHRTARQKAVGLLKSVAVAPPIACLVAATIAFFSRDFYASYWQPNGTDLAHVGFFVLSVTAASWALLLQNQWLFPNSRPGSTRKLTLVGLGALTGAATFGLSELYLVQYPDRLFSEYSRGIVQQIGRHELAQAKPTGIFSDDDGNGDDNNQQLHDPTQHLPALNSPALEVAPTVTYPVAMTRVQAPAESEKEVSAPATAAFASRPAYQINEPVTTTWAPTLTGYMVFFGSLFALRNWAKLTTYTRTRRFRWMSVAVSAGLAYLICCVVTFPTIWGMTWAAAITATVQLASPCLQRN